MVMHQDRINDNAHFAGIIDNIDLDQIDEEEVDSQPTQWSSLPTMFTKMRDINFSVPPSQSRL